MFPPPAVKRGLVMIDGQNLFHAARECFGQTTPSYDALALAQRICKDQGWELAQVRFYTGIPSARENPNWHDFWSRKLLRMSRQGVEVFTRELRYRKVTFRTEDGFEHSFRAPTEKGVDIRIALDLMRLTNERAFDAVAIFSQDQDFTEVVQDVRRMGKEQHRWLQVASAFPAGGTMRTTPRGINGTDWITIPWASYRECLDPMKYPRLGDAKQGLATPGAARSPSTGEVAEQEEESLIQR